MDLFNQLFPLLPDGRVLQVEIGLNWTAVVVDVAGRRACGLAATLQNVANEHTKGPVVRDAGRLEGASARELANLAASSSFTEVSVGLAAINALLPRPEQCVDLAAEDYIAAQGSDCRVALIGHFPFVDRLRPRVRDLWVFELNPQEGDLPASAETEVIPQADVLAITSTTLINHTFDEVFRCRKPGAKVMLLGPSTPLTPALFDLGIHVLSGSLVEDPDHVLPLVRQGANFRQIKAQGGVRLVTMEGQPEKSKT